MESKLLHKPTISIIVSMDENRGIGYQGKIPWHIKEDLIRFRDKTIKHTVIMGRKAFNYMMTYYGKSPRPIPNRTHIIITRNLHYQNSLKQYSKLDLKKVIIVNSFEEAVNKAKEIEKEEIFIAGGGQIYQQALYIANKVYLTLVRGKFQTDIFFPSFFEFSKISEKIDWKISGKNSYKFVDFEI